MSSRLRLPHCRKFPPRISQEDLKAQTTAVMKEKGANYHFQAQYYEATSHEVVGSKNPKFSTLQPSIKIHNDDDAWVYSFDFVFDFLQKNEMNLTLSTLNVELGKKKPARTDHFSQNDRNQYFKDLKQISNNLKHQSFSKHVNEFAKEEGISD
ncbi:hypothetical protein M9Y10_021592 [Tritrichomonas musculus]|uniref:LisH domain-containing protein n=1 Tax=Tritrichomonas musculus TaxID=1915356 RepID=A0ABR2KRZ6_9EUKA